MARVTRCAPLISSESHRRQLTELSDSRTAPVREVEWARVLLRYTEGRPIPEIQRRLDVSRPTIYTCIDKALATGVQVGLKDPFHCSKAWVVYVACTKLKEWGLAAELWTLSAFLVGEARTRAVEAGFPRLAAMGKTTV